MALHGAPGQPRDGTPLVIPVFYDRPADIVKANELQRHWSRQAVLADRRDWVRPERWAQNVSNAEERLQNVRLSGAKGEQQKMAERVTRRAMTAARQPLALPQTLCGLEAKAERLLAELKALGAPRLGLWLHGMGEWPRNQPPLCRPLLA